MTTLETALSLGNPDAIIATDAGDRVIHWNPAATAIFGYTEAEALGHSLQELTVPPDRLQEHLLCLARTRAEGRDQCETLRLCKNGSLVHVDVITRRLDGASTGCVLWCKRDITRSKVQRAARHLESQYATLLESAPDGMLIVDETGHVLVANANAERMFGYDRGTLRGRTVESLLPARYQSTHVAHRANYTRHPRVRSMGVGLELFGQRRDGEEFPVEVSLSPFASGDGALVAAAIRDATERKAVARRLQEQNEELRLANQAKTSFLASMSHELRTPLNAIIGFTGTLLMQLPGPLNPEQEKQLTTVNRAARHLLSLINDLLDLSRIESGHPDLHLERVECREVVGQAVDELRPLAAEKALELRLDLPATPVDLTTDRRALLQILINLVGNAVKYTAVGHVAITLRVESPAEGPFAAFEVADTGPGITEEDRALLFRAFSQLALAARSTRNGVGLGLHLSNRLAELLGGRIDLDSTPGEGSVFVLRLPAS